MPYRMLAFLQHHCQPLLNLKFSPRPRPNKINLRAWGFVVRVWLKAIFCRFGEERI
jgi:hypothetical protein